jgi:hypothetical protein
VRALTGEEKQAIDIALLKHSNHAGNRSIDSGPHRPFR